MKNIRDDFPFLQDHIYLDTCSIGLSYKSQGAVAASFYDEMKYQGMAGDPLLDAKREKVKKRIGNWLNVKENEVYFMSNLTEAANLIAYSLLLSSGDEIVVLEDDYPSITLCWEALAEKGIMIRKIPVIEEKREECLLQAINEKTRLIAFSQVQYTTGYVFDLEKVGKYCRERNILTFVDGTQGLNHVPTHIDSIDFYCASTYKWALGNFGLAILIVKNEVLQRLRPAFTGGRGRVLQYGTINHPMIWAFDGTLDYLEAIGFETIIQKNRELGQYLYSSLQTIGIDPVTDFKHTGSIVSFYTDQEARIKEALEKKQIYVSSKPGMVRIGAHFYNNQQDIDRLIEALKEVM